MKYVVLYVGHSYKPFWTKRNWPGWQGGSGKIKIGQNIDQNGPHFWLWSPLKAPKWVKDPWKGFKSTRGSWGYHLGSVSGVLDPFRGLQRAPKPKTRPILGNILTYFDLPWPPLPTRSNLFGSKWLVHVSHIEYYMFHIEVAPLGGILGPLKSDLGVFWPFRGTDNNVTFLHFWKFGITFEALCF